MPTDPTELVKRLRAACNGHPYAEIPWPHRILHEAADHIERTAAQPGLEDVHNCFHQLYADCDFEIPKEDRKQLMECFAALYAPASPPVAPPTAAADVTLDWPDEPGVEWEYWCDHRQCWLEDDLARKTSTSERDAAGKLILIDSDGLRICSSPQIMVTSNCSMFHLGRRWRRVAPSPCQRCVELESQNATLSARVKTTAEDAMQAIADLAHERNALQAAVSRLEGERDELQATLERVNNAKRLAQQRAEEVEARWKSLKKFVKSNAPQVNDATEETWGFAKAISKILSKMRELSIAAPPVETPDAARPQRSDEP